MSILSLLEFLELALDTSIYSCRKSSYKRHYQSNSNTIRRPHSKTRVSPASIEDTSGKAETTRPQLTSGSSISQIEFTDSFEDEGGTPVKPPLKLIKSRRLNTVRPRRRSVLEILSGQNIGDAYKLNRSKKTGTVNVDRLKRSRRVPPLPIPGVLNVVDEGYSSGDQQTPPLYAKGSPGRWKPLHNAFYEKFIFGHK